ncbi:thylakoid membrane photosystem I accumulation factor [Prochlorococcus sp. MIT 1223]|uniref:thylakoid membrane photosystem I accumulation factor n=1 Tax=Prochlorococcus sp. MIT 1223 TaxID=3096217 RepID=UPI002A76183E|nr:thylakoid membrane photosystem I accumulation factor [Prochlorococcus sp. MIT 1223]
MNNKIKKFICILAIIFCFIPSAHASLDNDSYEGNIFTIVTGNGALVPPSTTLSESLKNHRTSVLVFYLDDSKTSKVFAPVVSGIKLLWPSEIDLIPLTTDELQNKNSRNKSDPSYYWHGNIPQVVVINGEGEIILDAEGQVPIEDINNAISKSTGLKTPDFTVSIKSFNEYNSEAAKDGYADPR